MPFSETNLLKGIFSYVNYVTRYSHAFQELRRAGLLE